MSTINIKDVDVRSSMGSVKSLVDKYGYTLTPDELYEVALQKSRWFVESAVKVGWILKDEDKLFPKKSFWCYVIITINCLNHQDSTAEKSSLRAINLKICNKGTLLYALDGNISIDTAFLVENTDTVGPNYLSGKYGLTKVNPVIDALYIEEMKKYSFYDVTSYPMPTMTLEQAPLFMNDDLLSGYAKCLLEDRSLMDE